ncbi:hypothetical protein BGW36DRAFT_383572 [Talaromyces proteolyticus]|uniref:Uncharacterized protein n=1 Tax=Talaromyces proteolyticus TaxID=1131652 RepID=A0AAD4KJE9_9EURO|nr:uncharacterized protein BGW36DRAFT_383572 [Talaromyces proteolyticus]KAH8693721.1 hypothetical protein BGW36DRAFT_383572 [Talaromyces proteolyticus]
MEDSSSLPKELEGSTLGRNSRDDDQGSYRSKRSQVSGGFLLSSAYPTKSRRSLSEQHGQQGYLQGSGKRRSVNDEIITPKKRTSTVRTRGQQGDSLRASPLAAVTNASTSEEHDGHENGSATSRNAHMRASNPPAAGLDTDPAQIVNLALSLSESRRRTHLGRVPSNPLLNARRTTPNSAGLFAPSDIAQRSVSGINRGGRHPSVNTQDNKHLRKSYPNATSPNEIIANSFVTPGPLLGDDSFDMEMACSDATIARVEKAKQHFELFEQYLRLLSDLPPLPHSTSQAFRDVNPSRAYNPLQSIRNRKLRFREKCQIDVESEGWQDVSRVQKWVDSIETVHGHNVRDPYQCLSLPQFHPTEDGKLDKGQGDDDSVLHPLNSRANRTGTRPQRPRLEWVISPAELLADAAWLENDANKSKTVNSNGDRLYPDSRKLRLVSGSATQSKLPSNLSIENDENWQISMEQSTVLPSFEKSRPENDLDRVRHKRKLRNALHIPHSSSDGIHAPRWTRSNSLSSDSSSVGAVSRGRARKSRWGKQLDNKLGSTTQAEEVFEGVDQRSGSSKADSKASVPASQEIPAERRNYGEKGHGLVSPAGSTTGKEDHRMSLEEMDSTAPNSPIQGPIFPSITAKLSPPSSRSPSPRKRLPRVIGSLNERARSKRHNLFDTGESIDENPLETDLRKRTTADSSPKGSGSPRTLEPSPLPEPPYSHDDVILGSFQRSESYASPKPPASSESKLKGFLKGSRIAEIVGSEVSKMGDMIRRRDGSGHSRQSSYAASFVSDYRDSDEERTDGEPKQAPLRRGNTLVDDESEAVLQTHTGQRTSKTSFSHLSPFTAPLRHEDGGELSDLDSLPQDIRHASNVHFTRAHPSEPSMTSPGITSYTDRRNSYGFSDSFNSLESNRARKLIGRGTDLPVPGKPPVTGLASANPSVAKRPTLPEESRAWSLSERSIPRLTDPNTTEKCEILRCQALLLSSGIKAREIVCQANEPRDSPPKFLVRSLVNTDAPIPRIPRIDEFNYAARNLLERFENTKADLNKSMYRFSKSGLGPLTDDLNCLENLINNSLTPRVRAAALHAETLSTQLNTTSTLAIKQLSEALDKGVRKRNRRFRLIRRVGFVLLEWVLVGVMWWVWLVVMVFKVFRGIAKGALTSIRWVLWI